VSDSVLDDLDESHSVLDDLDELLRRFVIFPSREARTAVVLWVVHCHALDAFESTPRLMFLSPEKGSGKTRSLEVLALVVPTPMHAVNMSAAALFRVVADRQPTLLLDEADTYLGTTTAKQHEDIRGLINAGHRRGAMTYRGEVSGKTVAVVEFPAFAACALAGIGDLPDTILDRSVIVSMKKRAPHEQIEPFRERLVRPNAEALRERLAEWAGFNCDELRDAWPEMPDGIVDRAADVWEPLIAIADCAGAHWPSLAREAALRINAERNERDPSLGVQLLADCRRVFDDREAERITSELLVESLVALEESPWGDLRGKALDARGLARRLRCYGVRPDTNRFGDMARRGYLREDFHDAWQRYLVVDVADVADPGEKRQTTADEANTEDEVGYDLLSISVKSSLSSVGDPQRAQQAQQTTFVSAECLVCDCPYNPDAPGAESVTCPACVALRRGLVTPSEAGEMRLLARLALPDEAA
jgi:hypothetical protein